MLYESKQNKLERYEALQDILVKNKLLVLNKGAEIGVREGYFSNYILEHNPNLQLTCVDPYLPYQDVVNFYDFPRQDKWKEESAARLSKYGERVAWVYDTSAKASLSILEKSFDFVFIDAEHTMQAAYTDCRCWASKVREGGILCGHDYGMHPVRDGVNKFLGKRKLYHVPYLADIWVIQM